MAAVVSPAEKSERATSARVANLSSSSEMGNPDPEDTGVEGRSADLGAIGAGRRYW